MKLFSVDDHIIEPPDVWSKRVPAKFRDLAPRVIQEDGCDYWIYEDQRGTTPALNAVVGKPPEEWKKEPARFADIRPGCYDPKERVKDLLSESMTSSVSFPTLPRFGGALFAGFKDKQLADVCVKTWNDYLFEEWCAAAPEVFVPMVIVQLWDPPAAAKEIERNVERGARAITIPEESSQLGFGLPSYYDPYWDPIWAACQAADIPVCMHIGSSGWAPFTPDEANEALDIAIVFLATVTHSMAMAFSPVPRKFPDIKIVYSEGGIGWVPSALERADSRWKLHKAWTEVDDILPSEIVHRNMWFCMMPDEQWGLEQRHTIGIDRIVWECDYPHSNCPWPGTTDFANEFFSGVPLEDAEKICFSNAEKLFKWRCLSVPELQELGYSTERLPVGAWAEERHTGLAAPMQRGSRTGEPSAATR